MNGVCLARPMSEEMAAAGRERIPKIIHQIWVGDQSLRPDALMQTWRELNPEFEYMLWTEETMRARGLDLGACGRRVEEMREWCGKADIIRWVVLQKYGGVALDADSVCLSPLDDHLMRSPCFAAYEQEELRPGLIAVGTMGFPPNHPIVNRCLAWIAANCVDYAVCRKRAWQMTGPVRLTESVLAEQRVDASCMTVFPSYYFLPVHHSGRSYGGHGKVYAYQWWGSTHASYGTMRASDVPAWLAPPTQSVSILVNSLNTPAVYLKQCLDSIRDQVAPVAMEVVWVDDGSDALHRALLEKCLAHFMATTRHVSLVHVRNETNMGVGYSVRRGVELCSNELILKMDSDDVMMPDRVATQVEYMNANPAVQIMGGQIEYFGAIPDPARPTVTRHETMTWAKFCERRPHWFANHPTLCYRRSAALAVGSYDASYVYMEDFEFELRMLKAYGVLYNSPEVLVRYRIHANQLTHKTHSDRAKAQKYREQREELINRGAAL